MTPTATCHPATVQQGPGSSTPARQPEILDGIEVCIERAPRSDHEETGEVAQRDRPWPGRLRRLGRAKLRHWGLGTFADSVGLLLTELVTNALRHGEGPEVGVRLYRTGSHIWIEVTDGSPKRPVLRAAGPNDENGRGLYLVDGIADAWGVSDDGALTWCTLPLFQGPGDALQPTAVSAPVAREWSASLALTSNAVRLTEGGKTGQARMAVGEVQA